jgi:hypothetical protein
LEKLGDINCTEQGGKTISVKAPLERIPIYIRQGSILALGPPVQSADQAADPLEIRVYPGKDGDFELYEDKGDGYEYEHGLKAIVPIHWDNRSELLVIGPTIGGFQGMKKRHVVRVVIVRSNHGVGILPEANPDRVLEYDGQRIALGSPVRTSFHQETDIGAQQRILSCSSDSNIRVFRFRSFRTVERNHVNASLPSLRLLTLERNYELGSITRKFS